MSEETLRERASYYSEIGGDFKGIQGDISGGVINQYIITQKSGIEIKSQTLITGSPYLGLRKFEADDKDKFFGRDRWIRELTDYLEKENVLLLLGASGSGKSSLIQAGLIPKLKDNWGSNQFINLTFVPDVNPFESFYGCLLTKYKQSDAKLAQTIKEDTLIQVVRSLKKDSRWLIFIDQFEELFTRTPKTERNIFIKSLIELIERSDNSVNIILTMRADFLDKLSPYPDLGKIHDRYSRMLTDMDDSELRLAIAEPAARNGVIFEQELIEQIIGDFKQQAGSLPLLQYTLNLLWQNDNIQDKVLNTKTYQDLGGVTGALQKQANTIYDKFDGQQRKSAEKIFLELISLEGKEPVSRRADKAIFEQDNGQKDVLDQLIDNRLLVSRGEDGKATVEVAHEALLRSWKVLQELIRENEQIIILRNRLYADSKQWDELRQKDPQKASGELWSGSKLARIVELRKEQSLPNLDAVAIEFIEASDTQAHRQKNERIRNLWITTSILSVTAIVAIIAPLFSSYQWGQAQIQNILVSDEAAKANLSLGRPFDALLIAMRAGNKLKNPFILGKEMAMIETEGILQQALAQVKERNRLTGHLNSISSVSISPDGKTIASGSSDTTIKLWKIDTGKKITPSFILKEHTDVVSSVSFSPDLNSNILASGSWDGTIKLWDIKTGKVKDTFNKNPKLDCTKKVGIKSACSINSVSFSREGNTLAAANQDGTIKLWNIHTGKEIKPHNEPLKLNCTDKDKSCFPYSVSFSPIAADSNILASGSEDGTIELWDIKQGKVVKTLTGHQNTVYSVSFSRDGKLLASGSNDKTIKFWDTETGKELATFNDHNDAVMNVRFSKDGKTLASSSSDKTIKIWDIKKTEKECIALLKEDKKEECITLAQTLTGHQDMVYAISFSADNQTLVSGSHDNIIRLWDIKISKGPKIDQKLTILSTGQKVVRSVRFSPDGKTLASGGEDGTIKLWDTQKNKWIHTFPKASDVVSVVSISFSPDGKMLASGRYSQEIKLWDAKTHDPLDDLLKQSKERHQDSVFSVNFSPNGNILASGSEDKKIKLWDTKTGKLHLTLPLPEKAIEGHKAPVYSVSFSRNGQILASGSEDEKIKLWDTKTGKLHLTLPLPEEVNKGHQEKIFSIDISSDGKTLASGSMDNIIKLWNIQTGNLIRELFGHNNQWVYSVSFSPDGKTLASGGSDGTIKLWDVQTGQELITLSGHATKVRSVSFSPDGKTLASGSNDGTVILWSFDLDKLMGRSCDWVRGYLENPYSDASESDRHLCDGIGKEK